MTFTKQDKDALSKNWDQVANQFQSQFGVSKDDLGSERDPDQIVNQIAAKTGRDRDEIEEQVRTAVQSASGNA